MQKKHEFHFTPFAGSTLDDLDDWVQQQDERIATHFTRLRATTSALDERAVWLEEKLCRIVVREAALKVMENAKA